MLYRVEKDGRSFHIRPEQLEFYVNNDYAIYKNVEVPVTNTRQEIKAINDYIDNGVTTVLGGNNEIK